MSLPIELQKILFLRNIIPDWKGLISGGLIRGFTQYDIDSFAICVSICDCGWLGFILQILTQIVRFIMKLSNCYFIIGWGLIRVFTQLGFQFLNKLSRHEILNWKGLIGWSIKWLLKISFLKVTMKHDN